MSEEGDKIKKPTQVNDTYEKSLFSCSMQNWQFVVAWKKCSDVIASFNNFPLMSGTIKITHSSFYDRFLLPSV